MFRGNRDIILALGLILLGAGPPNEAARQPSDRADNKIERSLEDSAASIKDANKPSPLEKPCEEGDNNRDSDLCAQWKAAEAARSAANAAWIVGLLGTLVGALTLAAAFSAARWAKRAAIETEKGANAAIGAVDKTREANEIAREAQRPWLSAKARLSSGFTMGKTHLGVDGFYINVAGQIENHGDSPATDIHIIVDMIVPRAGTDANRVLSDFCDLWRGKGFSDGPALFKGQTKEFEHLTFISQADIDLALNDCGDFKMINPFVVGCVSYRSARFDGIRQTSFLYHVAAIEDGREKVIRADVFQWWQGDFAIMDHETIRAD